MPATYFFKNRFPKGDIYITEWVLILEGKEVGRVKTRKEARLWWEAQAS